MKSILFFLLFVPFVGMGQIPIDSFYVPGATWTVAYPWWFGPTCYYQSEAIGYDKVSYRIERDTIMSGIRYHLLALGTGSGYSFGCPETGFISKDNMHYRIFARIRVDSNRVYYTQDSTIEFHNLMYTGVVPLLVNLGLEYRLYDFNLTIGSSIYINQLMYNNIYVNSIDSVALSNGAQVAQYFGSAYCNGCIGSTLSYWIWGIGSKMGFLPDLYYSLTWPFDAALYPNGGLGGGYSGKNGSDIALCYDNPTFSYKFQYSYQYLIANLQDNCFDLSNLNTPVYSTSNKNQIDLYPNPAGTEITITASQPINQITINNLLGQTVFTNFYNNDKAQVDISGLANGMYFLSVNGTEMKKFLKQ